LQCCRSTGMESEVTGRLGSSEFLTWSLSVQYNPFCVCDWSRFIFHKGLVDVKHVQRERERVCVCVCVCVYIYIYSPTYNFQLQNMLTFLAVDKMCLFASFTWGIFPVLEIFNKFSKHIFTHVRVSVCECGCSVGSQLCWHCSRLAVSSGSLTSLLSSVFVTHCRLYSSTILLQQSAHYTPALTMECC
jgi:hypothetical protein